MPHSPLPWRMNEDGVIVDANGVILMSITKSREENNANRDLILFCVNYVALGERNLLDSFVKLKGILDGEVVEKTPSGPGVGPEAD